MTGRELLNILKSLPESDLDLQVELYLRDTEDGGGANSVSVLSIEDEPYYKGDGPWSAGAVQADERLIYIR